MDRFNDLLSNILEIRRYEKNYFFYPEPGSLKEVLTYIERTKSTMDELHDAIVKIKGAEPYRLFAENLQRYKVDLSILSNGGRMDLSEVRRLGTSMVRFAQDLLDYKKSRIHSALVRIQYMPSATMVGFVVLVVLLFLWQARRVLEWISYVQRMAEGVAKGHYEVIHQEKHDDEVARLMRDSFSKMAKEIEERQDQLTQSRKLVSIGTLTSGIAHELNNPLNNVSLTADTMLEEFGDLSEAEAKEMLRDIIDETSRASAVVRNLLDFSRQGGHIMRRLAVADLMEQTLKLVGNQLMVDRVRLTLDIPEDLPDILGELRYLEQVFINLFINATQSMEGGGSISVTARPEPPGFVRIDVADSGRGIKSEELERIFDPFYTTKAVGKGTGLGLSIVYGIIKKHEGYIEVQSEVGKGTTFSVHLPTMPEEEGVHGRNAGCGH
jgi:signal transduction histidine kinase